MSTLLEIKAAAATLPVEERSELVNWLSEADDVWEHRQGQLRREIQIGVDAIKRGDVAPLDMDDIIRKVHATVQAEKRR